MNKREDLLRAVVYRAFDERDEHGHVTLEAAKAVVDSWVLFPAIVSEFALERARLRDRGHDRDRAQPAAAAIRDSYVKPSTARTKRRREPLFNGWVTDESGVRTRATRDELRAASRLWYQHRDVREGRTRA